MLTVVRAKRLPPWIGASFLCSRVLKPLVTIGRFIFGPCLPVFALLCFTAGVCSRSLLLNMFGPGGL